METMSRCRYTCRIWLLLLALTLLGCAESRPATPAPPAKPHTATLTWKASTSKVSSYRIYRTIGPDMRPELLGVTPGDVTQYVDEKVDPGQTYYYSVKAVGANGLESNFSIKISVTVPSN